MPGHQEQGKGGSCPCLLPGMLEGWEHLLDPFAGWNGTGSSLVLLELLGGWLEPGAAGSSGLAAAAA